MEELGRPELPGELPAVGPGEFPVVEVAVPQTGGKWPEAPWPNPEHGQPDFAEGTSRQPEQGPSSTPDPSSTSSSSSEESDEEESSQPKITATDLKGLREVRNHIFSSHFSPISIV